MTGLERGSSSTSSFGPRDGLLLFQIGAYGGTGARIEVGEGMDVPERFTRSVYESLGGVGGSELSGFQCFTE